MLMAVKNQIKVVFLSIKYSLMMQMLNKVTFITNIIFMIINNATFVIQWLVLFNIKDNIGGFGLSEVLLLWGIASSSYGIAHIFFDEAFEMSKLIINGKLDTFLVQPKDVLLSVITSKSKVSAIGDLIYGYIIFFIYGFTIKNFLLFTMFIIVGGIVIAEVAVIFNSLCFWFVKGDILSDTVSSAMVNFATYPETIFKNSVRFILYTLIPVGISTYLPLRTIIEFNFINILISLGATIFLGLIAYKIFYLGLKRYSSSNLMSSRI